MTSMTGCAAAPCRCWRATTALTPTASTIAACSFLPALRLSGGSNTAAPTAPACPPIRRTRIRRFACSRSMPLTTYWRRLGAPCGPGSSRCSPSPADPDAGPGLGHSVTIPSRLMAPLAGQSVPRAVGARYAHAPAAACSPVRGWRMGSSSCPRHSPIRPSVVGDNRRGVERSRLSLRL